MYNVPKNKFGIIESDIKITNKEFKQVEKVLELVEPDLQAELKKVIYKIEELKPIIESLDLTNKVVDISKKSDNIPEQ